MTQLKIQDVVHSLAEMNCIPDVVLTSHGHIFSVIAVLDNNVISIILETPSLHLQYKKSVKRILLYS